MVDGGLVPVSLAEAAEDLLAFASRRDTRFGTGWSIDDSCGQVGTGEMALIWARSGAGKSTFFLNIIANTPRVPTVVFNMEMTPRRQQEWLTAMTCKMPVSSRDVEDVLRAGPDDDRFAEVERAVRGMSNAYEQVHFVNPSLPSVEDLGFVVDDIADATGTRPRRVFVDHMTLLGEASGYDGVNRTAAKLHSWAMREDLAVYVLQQTGRMAGGEGQRNDGHMPVTMSSGVFGGEADADWVFGLYRPDKNPKYFRPRHWWKSMDEYHRVQAEYQQLRGKVVLQVIKNRPFGDVNEAGIDLWYDQQTRRYAEYAEGDE